MMYSNIGLSFRWTLPLRINSLALLDVRWMEMEWSKFVQDFLYKLIYLLVEMDV